VSVSGEEFPVLTLENKWSRWTSMGWKMTIGKNLTCQVNGPQQGKGTNHSPNKKEMATLKIAINSPRRGDTEAGLQREYKDTGAVKIIKD
jgi:hypothetical protein